MLLRVARSLVMIEVLSEAQVTEQAMPAGPQMTLRKVKPSPSENQRAMSRPLHPGS